MKTIVVAAALLFSARSLPAESGTPADRILRRELSTSQAYDTLSELTDRIGPRLSGSAGAAAAVEWALRTFKSWSIDVHAEPVTVPHWVRGAEFATLPSHHDQKIVLTALGGSVATPRQGITAEVIEVHDFDQLVALGAENVRGKIVFYSAAMDMDLVRSGNAFKAYRDAVVYRSKGPSRAAELGAVASINRSVASASLRTPHTGGLKYDPKQPKIPGAAVAAEDAELLHRLLASGDTVTMHLVVTPQTLPDVVSANVVAEIRGDTRPDEVVLIGAHLDSWDLGTGAIDDGSGVANVMETMHLIKELGLTPHRTIRAVLYMNEENGGAGGKAYAERHKAELSKPVAAIESDSGAAAPTGFRTTVPAVALRALKQGLLPLASLGAADLTPTTDAGSDIAPLTETGVPGFGMAPDSRHYFDYHHTAADTLDKVDPKELAQESAAMAVLAWTLSEQPGYLPRIPTKREP